MKIKQKRFKEIQSKDKWTNQEQEEFDKLLLIDWINNEFFVQEYELNEVAKGF